MAGRQDTFRRILFWSACSGVAFAAAVGLTLWITDVNGRNAFDLKGASVTYGQKPPPVQVISIYAREPSEDLARQIGITYSGEHDGKHPFVRFLVPAGQEIKILLNNLTERNSCSAQGSASFSNIYASAAPVAMTVTGYAGADSWVVLTPQKADRPFSILCSLAPVAIRYTFTKSTAPFQFAVNGDDNPVWQALYPGLSQGFSPMPGEILSFAGIEGAEEFRFSGGFQDRRTGSFESARELTPGDIVTATWLDVNREEIRDILLVVIGTLVGISVTALIEAIRLAIDTPPDLGPMLQGLVSED